MRTVSRISGYVLHKQIEPTMVSRIGGFMLVGDSELPKAVSGKDAVENLILSCAINRIEKGQLVIGRPEAVERFNRNTRVLVTWPSNEKVDGSLYFYYDRAGVSRLKIPGSFTIEGETTTHQLLSRVSEITGMVLSETDFDNKPIDNGIELVATQDSYFFIPGSRVIVGGTAS